MSSKANYVLFKIESLKINYVYYNFTTAKDVNLILQKILERINKLKNKKYIELLKQDDCQIHQIKSYENVDNLTVRIDCQELIDNSTQICVNKRRLHIKIEQKQKYPVQYKKCYNNTKKEDLSPDQQQLMSLLDKHTKLLIYKDISKELAQYRKQRKLKKMEKINKEQPENYISCECGMKIIKTETNKHKKSYDHTNKLGNTIFIISFD